jgi:ribosome biogenesis protein Nip4
VWGRGKEMSSTQNFTRIKIISEAYTRSGSRVDFLYRNVIPEMIKSKVEETG